MNAELGPLVPKTFNSQNIANPPHNRLKGIINASLGRRRRPDRGAPDQMSDSPESSVRFISFRPPTPSDASICLPKETLIYPPHLVQNRGTEGLIDEAADTDGI
jgi:hypothetical protein